MQRFVEESYFAHPSFFVETTETTTGMFEFEVDDVELWPLLDVPAPVFVEMRLGTGPVDIRFGVEPWLLEFDEAPEEEVPNI